MEKLNFKKEVNFKSGQIYSVCLRGARRYDTSDEFDLSLYTPDFWDQPKAIASIVSQNQYLFKWLVAKDCIDNYDSEARTISGLLNAMMEVYDGFEEREIVTILRFQIV